MRNNERMIDNNNLKEIRCLIILNEIKILECIMKNVEKYGNDSCKEIVVELLIWRHCQSLSQGNCFKNSISRNGYSENEDLKKSFQHKNFSSFRNFVVKYHEKFGFDIISLLLNRTMSYSFIPLLINKLVIQHNNDWNILHKYQSIIIKHFESFSNEILSENNGKSVIKYFKSISDIDQKWLFAIIFIIKAVILTDDQVWIYSFKFIMEEIGDIIYKISMEIENEKNNDNIDNNHYLIDNDKIRNKLVNIMNDIWLLLKNSKYMMNGFMFKKLTLCLSHPTNELLSMSIMSNYSLNNFDCSNFK